jgi:hypothetical protein
MIEQRGQVHSLERGLIYRSRSSYHCMAWCGPDAFQGRPFRWGRGWALPDSWSIACGCRLVLFFRRSFRGASSRRCFYCRPIGIRSADIFPLGDRWSGPPFARDIRDYRSLTGNWRLDSRPSKGLNGLSLEDYSPFFSPVTTASTDLRTNRASFQGGLKPSPATGARAVRQIGVQPGCGPGLWHVLPAVAGPPTRSALSEKRCLAPAAGSRSSCTRHGECD